MCREAPGLGTLVPRCSQSPGCSEGGILFPAKDFRASHPENNNNSSSSNTVVRACSFLSPTPPGPPCLADPAWPILLSYCNIAWLPAPTNVNVTRGPAHLVGAWLPLG